MTEPIQLSRSESQVTIISNSDDKPTAGWLGRWTKLKCLVIIVVVGGLAIALAKVVFTSKPNAASLIELMNKTMDPCEGLNIYHHFNGNLNNVPTTTEAPSTPSREEEHEEVCLTNGCVKAAASLIESMNKTMDPCEDFYEFACGGFMKKAIITEDATTVSRITQLNDDNQRKLRGLLYAEPTPTDHHSSKMAKNFFKSCMDTNNIAKKGLAPLKDMLRGMGGWPVVEGATWNSSAYHWTHNIYANRYLGYFFNYLFKFSVIIDPYNSDSHIITIDEPSLGMPSREYLLKGLNNSEVQAYFDYQVDMAVLLGADRDAAENDLKKSLEFEIQIANHSLSQEMRRVTKTKIMTIRELEIMVPEIPWLEYTNRLLSPYHVVTVWERVLVAVPHYFTQLAKLLTATPNRVIANYMQWRATKDTVSFSSEEARDIQLEYTSKLNGQKTRKPRWEECVSTTSVLLPPVVGNMYARHFFKEEDKSAAEAMVGFIRREFEEILRTLDWLDRLTRARALRKAKAITSYVGYPPKAEIDLELATAYDELVFTDDDYLKNIRSFIIFGTNAQFRRLRNTIYEKKSWFQLFNGVSLDAYYNPMEMVSREGWVNYHGASVNAYYSATENSIRVPAGILQGEFFEADRPKYLNFGGIGFIIGHEITHGFDSSGRKFDASGNYRDWWETETNDRFLEKAQCMVHQYDNYVVPEVNLNVNGGATLKENIADNGGIKEAYYAYIAWTQQFGKEKKLPALPYTPKQLFWLSAANVWCSKFQPEALKLTIMTGKHSPRRFRVNGPFSNRPEFAADWKCPVGSKLNPVKKCSVW